MVVAGVPMMEISVSSTTVFNLSFRFTQCVLEVRTTRLKAALTVQSTVPPVTLQLIPALTVWTILSLFSMILVLAAVCIWLDVWLARARIIVLHAIKTTTSVPILSMDHAFAKTFTFCRMANVLRVSLTPHAGSAYPKLFAQNVIFTKDTNKSQSIPRVFADGNFPL